MPLVDVAHDEMLSAYGPKNVEPQPNLLSKTFEATCQLLVISRRIMDVVCVSSRLFLALQQGTNAISLKQLLEQTESSSMCH
jgi:hypothetical protein